MSGVSTQQRSTKPNRWSAGLSSLFGGPRESSQQATAFVSTVEEIGETAGAAWQVLDRCGPTELSELVNEIGLPRDQVVLALGWLAREEKLTIDAESGKMIVSLR